MRRYPWLVAAGAVFSAVVVFFVVGQNVLQFGYVFASIPPELQSAAAIESQFQNLPEEAPGPGALKIPIFIYHSVRPYYAGESKIQNQYDITPELFEQQLKYLHDNGYTTITLDELAMDMKHGALPPATKPVVLTFDDGWHNQYAYAFPLLKKYGATATFFIYTNSIGKRHFLTWGELKDMDAAGMTIGDHTLSHPYFKTLPLDKVTVEVTESKKIIERELGKPVTHFASPFGYSNPAIIAILKAAGYTTARTTYKGVYQDNPLRLYGILVSDDLNDFVKELTR